MRATYATSPKRRSEPNSCSTTTHWAPSFADDVVSVSVISRNDRKLERGSRITTEAYSLPPTPLELIHREGTNEEFVVESSGARKPSLFSWNRFPCELPLEARPEKCISRSHSFQFGIPFPSSLRKQPHSAAIAPHRNWQSMGPPPRPKLAPLKQGWLAKWTGHVGRWKSRWLEIHPGVLNLFHGPGDRCRDTLFLSKCTISLSADGVAFTISRTGGKALTLRAASKLERSEWLKVLTKAKLDTQTMPNDYPSRLPSHSWTGTQGSWLANENESDSEPERQPINHLMEITENLRVSTQEGFTDIAKLQSRTIQLAGLIRDPQGTDSLRQSLHNLLLQVNQMQNRINAHIGLTYKLLAEDREDRREMQRSMKRMARENYKLGLKLQSASTSRHAKGQSMRTAPEDEALDGMTTNKLATDASGPFTRSLQRATIGPTHLPLKTIMPLRATGSVPNATMRNLTDATEEFFDVVDEDREGVPRIATSVDTSSSTPTSSSEMTDDEDEMVTVQPLDEEPQADLVPEPSITSGRTNFRTTLPVPRTDFKVSLWNLLKDCIGKDLSRIALPVYFNEPTSFLQRLAEDYQYAELLEKAAQSRDPMERMLLVSVFSTTPFASAVGRTYKPFNPLLGETYELSHRGYKFHSEQVGHHPPMSAYHCSGTGFTAYGHLVVNTKFTGKSIEVLFHGPSNITLRHPEGHNEHYTFQKARMIVNNIIFGKMSMDVAGSYVITNHNTGDVGVVEFPKKGWWSSDLHPVRGAIISADGEYHYSFCGVWSQYISARKLCHEKCNIRAAAAIPLTTAFDLDGRLKYDRRQMDLPGDWESLVAAQDETEPFTLWQAEPRPPYAAKFYEFGYMTFELNDIGDMYEPSRMPCTDSRFRPDQRALEEGKTELSNQEKVRLEEKQRAMTRALPRGERDHVPTWYQRGRDPIFQVDCWNFDPAYWDAKGMSAEKLREHLRRCPNIF